MKIRVILSALGASMSPAVAQTSFSLVSWEVSLNGGQTWQGGAVEVADPFARLRVRAMVDWFHPGSYAFAHLAMDVTITAAPEFGAADAVLDPSRIAPFDSARNQTHVATRFGHVIKIDEVRDTLPPGVGPRWVVCSQLPENFSENFSTERPAPIFKFALQLDGTVGTRIVDHVYGRMPGEGESGPLVYLTPDGQMDMPRSILRGPLNLVVVPAPGALGVLLPLLLAAHRRRPSP